MRDATGRSRRWRLIEVKRRGRRDAAHRDRLGIASLESSSARIRCAGPSRSSNWPTRTDHQNAAPISEHEHDRQRNQQQQDVHLAARQRTAALAVIEPCLAMRARARSALPTTSSDDERHAERRDERRDVAERRRRNRDRVVRERPGEVLADDCERAGAHARSRRRPGRARRRARRRRRVHCASGVALPSADRHLRLRERRRVVDAVADHRDDRAVRLQRARSRRACPPARIAAGVGDAERAAATCVGRRAAVARQQRRR